MDDILTGVRPLDQLELDGRALIPIPARRSTTPDDTKIQQHGDDDHRQVQAGHRSAAVDGPGVGQRCHRHEEEAVDSQ